MRPPHWRPRRWVATLPLEPGLTETALVSLTQQRSSRSEYRQTVLRSMLILLGGCAVVPGQPVASRVSEAPMDHAAVTRPVSPVSAAPAARFLYSGSMTQGGLILGTAPDHTIQLSLDGAVIPVASDGRFVIAFDRDAGLRALLSATLADGRVVTDALTIAPRAWDISRLDTLAKIPVPQPEFDRLRPAELAQIAAARRIETDAQGWRQASVWPTTGRISTLFGSQRIYRNGEAGSYHSGLDVAKPTGSVIVAPADGVVILVADHPFTLEGNLLMIDHGMGLNHGLPASVADRRAGGGSCPARATRRPVRRDRSRDRAPPALEPALA